VKRPIVNTSMRLLAAEPLYNYTLSTLDLQPTLKHYSVFPKSCREPRPKWLRPRKTWSRKKEFRTVLA